jgi:hypothetical protein
VPDIDELNLAAGNVAIEDGRLQLNDRPAPPPRGPAGLALVAFLRGLRHRHRDPRQRGIKLLCRNPSTG